MSKKFIKPDFSKKDVELRFEDNVVCVYATKEGLKKIADFCNELINNPEQGHIHLEDYGILTNKSEKGAIAIFSRQEKNCNAPY